MVASRRQISPCPVCHRGDQVKKMQAAYNAGDHHFAPPPMPESHASMMKYISAGMALIAVGASTTLILLAANGWGWFPSGTAQLISIIQAAITVIFIVLALALAFFAFRHIGQGDEEARRLYPIWDRAMANWERMRYCARDKVVFDVQTNNVLSEATVSSLLSMEEAPVQDRPRQVAAATR